jgi:cytochrome P450
MTASISHQPSNATGTAVDPPLEAPDAEETSNTAPSAEKDTADPSIVDAQSWASRVTLDIIGVAGMGHDFGAVKDPHSPLADTYRELTNNSGGRAVRALQLLFFLAPRLLANLPFARNRMLMRARGVIRKVCFDLIDEKRQKLEKKEGGKDILSVAIESGGFEGDEDIVNQLMTFLAAGHETTASAMAWACYHLCAHPSIQSRLRSEIRATLPSPESEAPISFADFDKLTYLHAVCNEILRLYPSVPITTRVTASSSSTILDTRMPKGTTVVICPWAINTHPDLWGADADKFDPERWMAPGQANSGGASSNYALLTFLHGPRSCIGQSFAKAEFAVLLASWVGRFEMEFVDPEYKLDVGGGVTSKPKGMRVRMKAVDGW